MKNKILEEVYNSDEIKKFIMSVKPAHLREDILQHVFLEMLQKPDYFIQDLIDRKKLKHYIIKVLYNTAFYKRTTFKKLIGDEITFSSILSVRDGRDSFVYAENDFRPKNEEHLREVVDYAEKQDEVYQELQVDLSKLHWYKSELLKMYSGVKNCNCGNLIHGNQEKCCICGTQNTDIELYNTYQKISDATSIPVSKIYRAIAEAKVESKGLIFDMAA